jgi:hypothetical protein
VRFMVIVKATKDAATTESKLGQDRTPDADTPVHSVLGTQHLENRRTLC